MSTLRTLVTDALLELGAVAISDPVPGEMANLGLNRFTALLSSLFGLGIGIKLRDLDLSTWPVACEVEPNTRLLAASITTPMTFLAPSSPCDGARLQLIDPNGKITLSGRFSGSSTATGSGFWMYRADQGVWARAAALTLDSDLPFSDDCYQAFVSLLAMRLAPPLGIPLSPEAQLAVAEGKALLKARFRQTQSVPADLPVVRTSLPVQMRRWGWMG